MTTPNTHAARVPDFTGDVAAWVAALHAAGLCWHIDDDAADCLAAVATPEEIAKAQAIADRFTRAQREEFFTAALTESKRLEPNFFEQVAAAVCRYSPAMNARAGQTAVHVRNGFQTWHFNHEPGEICGCEWSATLSLDGWEHDPIATLQLPLLDSGSSPAKVAAHILAALGLYNLNAR